MMLPGVNRAFNGYGELRKFDVPLDTEPAFRFYPTKPVAKPAKFSPTLEKPKSFVPWMNSHSNRSRRSPRW